MLAVARGPGPAIAAAPKAAGKVQAAPPAAMAKLPPAVIDDTLAIGGKDIAARELSTRLTVPVTIDGHGPYRFIVDSGADTSVVGLRIAAALRLPPGSSALMNGMTGSARVERVLVGDLHLGQSDVRELELPVLREGDIGAEGMIGINALAEQRLVLDFERRSIRIEDALRPVTASSDEIVVTARLQRGQLILTRMRANNKMVDAVVDTGSEITIGNLALRNALFGHSGEKPIMIEVTGVTGVPMNMELVYVAELRLGSVILRHVPIAFADVPPFAVFDLADHPSLLLGTDLMATFRRVSLDFHARKVRFQLRRCAFTGVTIGTSPYASLTHLAAAAGNEQVCQ
jgi:predicted aspartyl protease